MLARRFGTTQWDVVVAAGRAGAGADASAALSTLCETYWFPVYAYIRRSGKSVDDARDLTQAFFARMIEKNDVRMADPARGRFRSFLLASVRHFLANQHRAATALKRGGGAVRLPIETNGDEFNRTEERDDDTPERVFERRWAIAVLDAAMERLAKRYSSGVRRQLFETLRPCLSQVERVSSDTLERLDMSQGALRVALHRLRRAFREELRAVIRETVHHPEDVDDELTYLLAVVSR